MNSRWRSSEELALKWVLLLLVLWLLLKLLSHSRLVNFMVKVVETVLHCWVHGRGHLIWYGSRRWRHALISLILNLLSRNLRWLRHLYLGRALSSVATSITAVCFLDETFPCLGVIDDSHHPNVLPLLSLKLFESVSLDKRHPGLHLRIECLFVFVQTGLSSFSILIDFGVISVLNTI
jgi:hypothetical protein